MQNFAFNRFSTLLSFAICSCIPAAVHADIIAEDRAFVLKPGVSLDLNGLFNETHADDLSSDVLFLNPNNDADVASSSDATLTIDSSRLTLSGGTFTQSGVTDDFAILATPFNDGSPIDTYKSLINVINGGEIAITASGGNGSIILDGKSDLDIKSGGKVSWAATDNCNSGYAVCDILIGRYRTSSAQHSNSGILIDGPGSILDSSNTGGEIYVGGLPGIIDEAADPNVDGDFLAVVNGGSLITNRASVALADYQPGSGHGLSGEVRSLVVVDNATWDIIGSPTESADLNIGEEYGNDGPNGGGSANVFIQNAGKVSFTASAGNEAGFFLGQKSDGTATAGSNLMVIDGLGSSLTVNSDLGVADGSRVASGFVQVQNNAELILNNTSFAVGGKIGAVPSAYNIDGALNSDKGSSFLLPGDIGNLDIRSGGSVTLTNGDLFVGALAGDDATVRVDHATINAPRVIVGLGDYDFSASPYTTLGLSSVAPEALSGHLILDNGTVNGDVIVDDNGRLSGIGTINGTLFAEGGIIDPGFSPGTITVEQLILGSGTLLLEIGIDNDGNIDTSFSDMIIATQGPIDLSGGSVVFDLIDSDGGDDVESSLANISGLLDFSSLFDVMDPSNPEPIFNNETNFLVAGLTTGINFLLGSSGQALSANRISVPEPSTLALFGLGLLGVFRPKRSRG